MNTSDRSISHLNRILSLTKCKNCFKYKITKMKIQCRHLLCSECDTLSCKICSKHSIGIDIHVYTFLHDLLSRNCNELNEFKIYRKKEDIWVESQEVFEENICVKNNLYKYKYESEKEGKQEFSDLKGEIMNLKNMFFGEEKNAVENKKNNENEPISTLAESSFAIPFTSPVSTQKSNNESKFTQSVSSDIPKEKEIKNKETLCVTGFDKNMNLRDKERTSRLIKESKYDITGKKISNKNNENIDKISTNFTEILNKNNENIDKVGTNCTEIIKKEKQILNKNNQIVDIMSKNGREIIEKNEKQISKNRFDGIKITENETNPIITTEDHPNSESKILKNIKNSIEDKNIDSHKKTKHEISPEKSSKNPIISLTTKSWKNKITKNENSTENQNNFLPNLKSEPPKNIKISLQNSPNQVIQPEIQNQTNLDAFVFLTSGLSSEENIFISKTFWSLQNKLNIPIEIKSEYSSSITHLIVNIDKNGCCLRTLKYLLCILNGVKVVSYSWYKKLIKVPSVEEKDYFIKGDNISGGNNVPYQIYKNAQNGIFYFNKINFLIEKKFITKDLRKVIKNGKGKINENNFEFTNLKVQNEKEIYNFISNGTFLNYKAIKKGNLL
ncbi:hypothetical protein CWI37_1427p0010 [Hamiltosporidium tvaerminnensis]|uniref:BRCT domain-containing protein n=1 Tax=Hamiltosporidium tvaerminnensis TaxID=1176355 RepID=A0A4Q9KX21_9MICR|nr:hypothetical protein LUQ84_003230 [Hamiltosporidium tvaerminnensis]TBT99195.1 hypothetical protein CWI37_1427p0010 [Hamiltosporidium tvaerminnensis]